MEIETGNQRQSIIPGIGAFGDNNSPLTYSFHYALGK